MQDPDEEIAKIDRTVRSQCGSQVGTFSDWVEVEAPLIWGQIESHACLLMKAFSLTVATVHITEHCACHWALTSASLGIPGRAVFLTDIPEITNMR